MSLRLRISPFLKDVLLTIATSVATMVALVLVTRWLAVALSTEEFGAYSLSRRVVTWAGVYASVLGVTLTRNLAATSDQDRRIAYLLAATIAGVLPVIAVVPLAAVLARPGAALIFGDARHAPVLASALGLVAATVLYILAFARHRGQNQMGRANLWQLWGLAAGPAIVAYGWAGTRDVALINWLTALAMAVAVVPLGFEMLRHGRAPAVRRALPTALDETVRYGAPRVPGGLAVGALLAIGPLLTPHFGSLADAGFLVAGQSVLRIVEAGAGAFGIVALPKVTSLRAAGDAAFLRERVEDIIALTVHVGLFLCWAMTLWTPEIVLVWLGRAYSDAIPIVRIQLLAVVPYLGYAILRSVTDALDERPIIARNSGIALALTVVLSVVAGAAGLGVTGLAIAGTIGFSVLGFLTIRFLWRSLGLSGGTLGLGPVVLANLALGGVVVALRSLFPAGWGPEVRLAMGLAASAASGVIYVLLLRRLGSRWIRQVELRLLHAEGRPMSRAAGVLALLVTLLVLAVPLQPSPGFLGVLVLAALSAVLMHAGTGLLNPRRVTITGFFYWLYLCTVFIPGLVLAGQAPGPAVQSYVTAIVLTLVTVPAGALLANAATGFRRGEIADGFAAPVVVRPVTLHLQVLLAALILLALGLSLAYLVEVEQVPLFALLRNPGDAAALVLLREESFKLLDSPLVYAYDVLRRVAFPFLICVLWGLALTTRARAWWLAFSVTLVAGLFYSALSLAKAPPAAIILVCCFFAYLYKGGRVTARQALVGGGLVVSFPLLILIGLYASSGVTIEAMIGGLFHRMFQLPAEILYHYFEYFPDHQPHLHGATIGRVAWLLGQPPANVANTIFQYMFPTGLPSGMAPAAFIGYLHADFGLAGVAAGGLLAGFLLQGIQVLLLRRPRTVMTLAAWAFMYWAAWQLNLTAMPQTFLSGGILLVLVAMWLIDSGEGALAVATAPPGTLAPRPR